jgi:phosphoglycolate phosphatase
VPASFDLLVFDWDGTLMDSEARIVGSLRAAIGDLGWESRETTALRNIIGLGLREAALQLYPDLSDTAFNRFVDRYRHHFLFAHPAPSELFPGAADTVRELHRRGYRLAVATGKGRQGLNRVLADTGLRQFFHATRCADETASKPHPQMLLELMEELDVEPARTLMIGDTEYDMEMARNARTPALAVSYGVHERERLLQHAPRDCIDAIDRLISWLDRA